MPTYELNWNYRPAYEKLVISKVSPAGMQYPIVNFFKASVNESSSLNDCLTGSYYVDSSYNFVTGNWQTQLKSILANGNEEVFSGRPSGTYGIKPISGNDSGYFWSSWQQDYAPAADGDGYLREVAYDIAMPQSIKIYTSLPVIYRTIFPDLTDTRVECTNLLHNPVSTAWSPDNCTIEFTEWSSNHISEYPEGTFSSYIPSDWLVRSDDSESITASDLNSQGIARFTGYNTVYYNTNGVLKNGSTSNRYIRSEYTGYSYDPTVKKVIYSNPTADDNLIQTNASPTLAACKVTFDGYLYQYNSYNTVHPNYFSPVDSSQYIDLSYPIPLFIGLDHYRKTSITVKYANVTTVYNGTNTTTTVGSTATEVFSDDGIFYIDGIQLVINKWQKIDQPSYGTDLTYNPILIRLQNDVTEGTKATLLEVAYY